MRRILKEITTQKAPHRMSDGNFGGIKHTQRHDTVHYQNQESILMNLIVPSKLNKLWREGRARVFFCLKTFIHQR